MFKCKKTFLDIRNFLIKYLFRKQIENLIYTVYYSLKY